MNIADLFVNLKLVGNGEVKKGLGELGEGLGSVHSLSLETKAAILGVIYGFEQMFSKSMQMGASLSTFSTLTGIGTKELQQYRWAMEGVGGSADEVQSNMRSLQTMLTNIDFNKGTPEGMGVLQQLTGGMTHDQMQDTLYVMQRLQTLSKMGGISDQVKNHVLDTFGISDGVKAAMRLDAFNQKALNSAHVLSRGTLDANRRAKGAWSHFGTDIENAFATFNGKHGEQIISDIAKITTGVIHLVEALVTLSEKLRVFELMGAAAEKIAKFLDIIGFVADDSLGNKKSGANESMFGSGVISNVLNWRDDMDKKIKNSFSGPTSEAWRQYNAQASGGSGATITNNIVSHNHGVKDAKDVGKHVGAEVKRIQQTSPLTRMVK